MSRLAACLWLIAASLLCACRSPGPRVEHGEIDLRSWSLVEDGPIRLDGDWDLWWGALLAPESLGEAPGQFAVPESWNGHAAQGRQMSGRGGATYRVRVRLDEREPLALYVQSVGTAYRLYVDGRLRATRGRVSLDRAGGVPSVRPRIVKLGGAPEDIELVLQVSNHHYRKGGLWRPITLGTVDEIRRLRDLNLLLDGLILGSLGILALYHLGLWLYRREDEAPAWFALFCLLSAVRTSTMGEILILGALPDMGWQLYNKVNYLSLYMIFLAFTFFLDALFPGMLHRVVPRIVAVFYGLLCGIVLITPVEIYSYTPIPFQIGSLALAFYALGALAVTAWRGDEGARLVLVAFTALLVTVVNDILYANQLVQTSNLFPLGVLAFVFPQSFLLSRRLSLALTRVEGLTRVFQRFVPGQFLDRIAREGPEDIEPGRARVETLTILFADVRDSEALSRTLRPQALLDFINAWLPEVVAPVRARGGFVDKFIGDAVMALFDRPGRHPEDALAAAVDMQRATEAFNARAERPVTIGVGVHTGLVTIGTIGSRDRMDSTVLGDAVNLASRLEGVSRMYGARVVTSGETLAEVPEGRFRRRLLDVVQVKGRSAPVSLFEVLDAEPEAVAAQKAASAEGLGRALDLRAERRFIEAVAVLDALCAAHPWDLALAVQRRRCLGLAENPPPEDWSGAVALHEKK
ncbi:MAG: adenylate/guanylate cyclase domain-containing protein [Alphaproteobacteria bacterium]|nr:adenylate/guanylate cyclase domain-containing protein [Alphaproteobacteria bacterium]